MGQDRHLFVTACHDRHPWWKLYHRCDLGEAVENEREVYMPLPLIAASIGAALKGAPEEKGKQAVTAKKKTARKKAKSAKAGK